VGLVIGKGGETIKSMQAKSGAQIKVCLYANDIGSQYKVTYGA
jgi:hypothetical protein